MREGGLIGVAKTPVYDPAYSEIKNLLICEYHLFIWYRGRVRKRGGASRRIPYESLTWTFGQICNVQSIALKTHIGVQRHFAMLTMYIIVETKWIALWWINGDRKYKRLS